MGFVENTPPPCDKHGNLLQTIEAVEQAKLDNLEPFLPCYCFEYGRKPYPAQFKTSKTNLHYLKPRLYCGNRHAPNSRRCRLWVWLRDLSPLHRCAFKIALQAGQVTTGFPTLLQEYLISNLHKTSLHTGLPLPFPDPTRDFLPHSLISNLFHQLTGHELSNSKDYLNISQNRLYYKIFYGLTCALAQGYDKYLEDRDVHRFQLAQLSTEDFPPLPAEGAAMRKIQELVGCITFEDGTGKIQEFDYTPISPVEAELKQLCLVVAELKKENAKLREQAALADQGSSSQKRARYTRDS
ncbi:hypothetical protein JCM11641_002760 [Rhodosporidiobolus odoratus]